MLNSIEEISSKKRNTCVIVLLNQIGGYLEPKQKSFHRHLLIVLQFNGVSDDLFGVHETSASRILST